MVVIPFLPLERVSFPVDTLLVHQRNPLCLLKILYAFKDRYKQIRQRLPEVGKRRVISRDPPLNAVEERVFKDGNKSISFETFSSENVDNLEFTEIKFY